MYSFREQTRNDFEEARKKRECEVTEQMDALQEKLHEAQSQLTLTRRELETLQASPFFSSSHFSHHRILPLNHQHTYSRLLSVSPLSHASRVLLNYRSRFRESFALLVFSSIFDCPRFSLLYCRSGASHSTYLLYLPYHLAITKQTNEGNN